MGHGHQSYCVSGKKYWLFFIVFYFTLLVNSNSSSVNYRGSTYLILMRHAVFGPETDSDNIYLTVSVLYASQAISYTRKVVILKIFKNNV